MMGLVLPGCSGKYMFHYNSIETYVLPVLQSRLANAHKPAAHADD